MQFTGTPSQIAAIRAALSAAARSNASASCATPGCGCGGGGTIGGSGPCVVPPETGALAGISGCLTLGTAMPMCAPGAFSAYTVESPLFLTRTPTGRDFDVPCLVAEDYFARIAQLCQSNIGIIASLQVGNASGCCTTTQVASSTSGNSASFVLTADPGCEVFTPGLLFTVGFADNVSPGPFAISVSLTGQDGCAVSMNDIRGTLRCQGSGSLALLFGCVEDQRLYPVIARMRTSVEAFPSGTAFPGIGTTTGPTLFGNESITINVSGPPGMTLTIQTLNWNHPTISCLWQRAMGSVGAGWGGGGSVCNVPVPVQQTGPHGYPGGRLPPIPFPNIPSNGAGGGTGGAGAPTNPPYVVT